MPSIQLSAHEDARQIAGSLIMVRITGTELDADTAQFLRTNGIRAVCLFRQNMHDAQQLLRLTTDLRAVMGPQCLIALDQEGGAVVRVTWVPAPPSAMALGAVGDVSLAREVGAAVARAIRALGFNWNFAPVLDLNNNPHNPVIAERSFGSEAQPAAALAMAWMAGSHAEGVACCVKHFPGHGDTHVDSHRALPVVDKSLAELEQGEFAPFRLAMADAPAMMSAHIVYPALDATNPATLSHAILTDLLRSQWQYAGVVITDSMDMQAIAGIYGAGAAAVQALAAGADMVMALGDRAVQEQTLDAISEAILNGGLALADMRVHQRRLTHLAQAYPSQPDTYQTADADTALMARAWRAALTLRGAHLPDQARPPAGSAIRLVMRQASVSDGVSEVGVSSTTLMAVLAQGFDVALTTFTDAEQFDWHSLPEDGRFVILASTSRLRYGPQVRAHWRPDLHLALWNPYQALDIAAPALMTYGFATPALEAVLAWLTGELTAAGTCPVSGFA